MKCLVAHSDISAINGNRLKINLKLVWSPAFKCRRRHRGPSSSPGWETFNMPLVPFTGALVKYFWWEAGGLNLQAVHCKYKVWCPAFLVSSGGISSNLRADDVIHGVDGKTEGQKEKEEKIIVRFSDKLGLGVQDLPAAFSVLIPSGPSTHPGRASLWPPQLPSSQSSAVNPISQRARQKQWVPGVLTREFTAKTLILILGATLQSDPCFLKQRGC